MNTELLPPEEAAENAPASSSDAKTPSAVKTDKQSKKEKKELEKASRRKYKIAEKAAERVAASHAAAEKEAARAGKQQLREIRLEEKLQKKAAELAGVSLREGSEPSMYDRFCAYSFIELEQLLREAKSREEKAFYRSLLNLKLQIEQEKVIGEVLL